MTLIILVLNTTATFAQRASVSPKEFQLFTGNWEGALTYLDYSSNMPYIMPANLIVRQLGVSNNFIFSNVYPNEPKANSFDTLTIAINNNMINRATIVSKKKLYNGDTEIITELLGKDGNDNKQAIIKTTYKVGKFNLKNIKEVQFVGQQQWIKRHEYSYHRK